MTPRQVQLVQSSFEKLAPSSGTVAATFYERLFEVDPSVQLLFKADLVEQRTKLMQMLAMCVRGLAQIERLVPLVRDLGRRHAAYGTTQADFSKVGDALMFTLRRHLGTQFTAETEAAWLTAYETLAVEMSKGLGSASIPE